MAPPFSDLSVFPDIWRHKGRMTSVVPVSAGCGLEIASIFCSGRYRMDSLATHITCNPSVDRRKHKRFGVRDGGIALLTPRGPSSTVVGDILDISMTGLSFRYLADGAAHNGSSKVTIAFPESTYYLRELPIETVSDFEIAKMPFGSLSPRRRSLKFGSLTQSQRSHLEYFIRNHTVTATSNSESC